MQPPSWYKLEDSVARKSSPKEYPLTADNDHNDIQTVYCIPLVSFLIKSQHAVYKYIILSSMFFPACIDIVPTPHNIHQVYV